MLTKALKRVVSGACAVGLVASCISPAYAAVTLFGDANGDSSFNASDLAIAQSVLLDTQSIGSQYMENCDMNSDGVYNAVDLLIMRRTPYVTASTDDNTVTAIEYASSSVTLYNATGAVVAASDASNVTVANNTYVTIIVPGEFNVSGSCSSGQLVVNCDKTTYSTGLVTLNLMGLELSNTSTSPIYIAAIGDEVEISSKNGYTNTISDGTSYTNDDGDSGAIYACDDIKFKGKGTLNVNGNCADAIVCKNDIKIWNGTLNVTAVDDGIRGKDSVRIGDPDDTDYSYLNVTVTTSAGDGIKSTNADDASTTDKSYGMVRISGGTVNVTAMSDGIQGEQSVEINGGDITVTTTATTSSSTTDASAKGIKAVGLFDTDGTTYLSGGSITINGGNINVNSTDDAVHCYGDLNIVGGNLTLASGDDGIHSDTNLTIGTEGSADLASPYVNITKSYEGIEGVNIYMNSGSVYITADDDGYNAAGGNDGSGSGNTGSGWNPGGMGGGMSTSTGTLYINGGYTFMQAKGDGLDSNGPLYFNGGITVVNGFTSGDTSPLDSDQTPTYSGGTLLAYGASNMAVYPNTYAFATTSANVSAGSRITFTNSSGTILSTVTVPSGSAGQYLVYCNADSSVTCYTGGTVSGVTMFDDYYGEGGTISGGSQLSSSGGGNTTNPWG